MVTITVSKVNASVDGKWDPVGENLEERHITVSADGAEVKLIPKTVKTITNTLSCGRVVINS